MERKNAGFSNATPAMSANQAFKAYLAATGEPGSSKKNLKTKFKDWIQKQKENGNLDKAMQAGAQMATTMIQNHGGGGSEREVLVPASEAGNLKNLNKDDKPRIMGMTYPVAAIVGSLAVVAIVVGVVALVKRSKKGAAAPVAA